jgi:hypothetical protein
MMADVRRFGSKADVTLLNFDVRFTPESGHSPTRSGCLLWAKLGHRAYSFNDLVGDGEHARRDSEAERLGRLSIDEQSVFRRQHDW